MTGSSRAAGERRRRPRVVRVHPSLNPHGGGIVSALRSTSLAMSEAYDVTIVTQDTTAQHHQPFAEHGVHVESVPTPAEIGRYAHEADLVILEGAWNRLSVPAAKACRDARVPYLYAPHGGLNDLVKAQFPIRHLKKLAYWMAVERRLARQAHAVWYASDIERDRSATTFPGTPSSSVVIPFASRQVLGTKTPRDPAAPLHIVTAARVRPVKDLDVLVRAMAVPGADWRLTVAGDDATSHGAQLRRLASELGVAQRISWRGFLPPVELDALLLSADAYACPGLESFGMSVAEALSSGLPIIASDAVALAPALGDAGAVFARGDVAGLAAAVAVTDERVRAGAAGEAPRKVWGAQCSPERFRAAFDETVGPLVTSGRRDRH